MSGLSEKGIKMEENLTLAVLPWPLTGLNEAQPGHKENLYLFTICQFQNSLSDLTQLSPR